MAQLHKRLSMLRQLCRTLLLATGKIRLTSEMTLISTSNLKNTSTWWPRHKSLSCSSIFCKQLISKATFSKSSDQTYRSLKSGTISSRKKAISSLNKLILLMLPWTLRAVLWSTLMSTMSNNKSLTTIRLNSLLI